MELGVNFNGDLTPEHIVRGGKIAETVGYHYIWIGEAVEHMHPLPIIALLSQETEAIKIGTGIIALQLNRCQHIITAFRTLQEAYGNRFVVGLAPGDVRGLKTTGAFTNHLLKEVRRCIREFRKRFAEDTLSESTAKRGKLTTLPIFLGASGPKMLEMGSIIADGVLMNYVYPKFLRWALKFFQGGLCRKVAYGPALLQPDKQNLKVLRRSTAIVFSGANKAFLEEFGLRDTAVEIRRILQKKQFHRLEDYDDILLEKFAICGSLSEVEERVEEIKTLGIDQIVFSSPLCRNLLSIKKIGQALEKKEYV